MAGTILLDSLCRWKVFLHSYSRDWRLYTCPSAPFLIGILLAIPQIRSKFLRWKGLLHPEYGRDVTSMRQSALGSICTSTHLVDGSSKHKGARQCKIKGVHKYYSVTMSPPDHIIQCLGCQYPIECYIPADEYLIERATSPRRLISADQKDWSQFLGCQEKECTEGDLEIRCGLFDADIPRKGNCTQNVAYVSNFLKPGLEYIWKLAGYSL